MAEVVLRDLVKVYDQTPTVKGINLHIEDQSFVVLVGPSGCGKSTTLRMIAGLESVSYGDIYIGDRRVNDVPSRHRKVAMVFQSYALYPHLSVRSNLNFGLRMAKTAKHVVEQRVDHASEVLELAPYLDRKPAQLSGGQRQRVAMGRAMVREPDVFLFDEPLSNLDAKLRHQMRSEIKKLHKRLKNTVIYVTHDQIEAMTLADKIVIMRGGFIEQVGSPLEVFNHPANMFVASFIGAPQMNFFSAVVTADGHLKLPSLPEPIAFDPQQFTPLAAGQEVMIGVRPENIVPEGHGMPPQRALYVEAPITMSESLGNETLLFSAIGPDEFIARMQQPRDVADGERLRFAVDLDKLHLFNPESERTLRITS